MFHRVRLALESGPMARALSGTVEIDETYMGGKPRYRHASNPRGTANKAPVMVLVEPDGMARVKPVEFVDTKTLHAEVINAVEKSATVMTDEMASYRNLGRTSRALTTSSRTVNASTLASTSRPQAPNPFRRL